MAPVGEKEAEPAEKLLDINVQTCVSFGIAVCLHSLIDGLAIGVFKESGEMYVLAASIIIHKVPVSCTLGFTFQKSGLQLRTFSTLTIFILYVLSAPIGLAIGAVISDNSLDTTLVII